MQQPACHRFIARHLYNFFVADEAQVPAWQTTPPRDPEAIDTIAKAFAESHYDMRSTLRVLFLSDFFKNARFARIKSPAEVVVGLMRLAGGFEFPAPGIGNLAKQPDLHGAGAAEPAQRRRLAYGGGVDQQRHPDEAGQLCRQCVGRPQPPGHSRPAGAAQGARRPVPRGVRGQLSGPHRPAGVEPEVRQRLVEHASEGGTVRWGTEQEASTSRSGSGEMLQMIASLREFQYC